jgi:ABC-type uncharacterized transport system ATPase subunit
MAAETPLVEMRGITKIYPNGVVANREVDFEVRAGEVHALVGENGAGKTTLMKILYGLEQPDGGQIRLRGQPIRLRSPNDAMRWGIGMVHQNFMLVPGFTVAENVVLGREPARRGLLDRREAARIVQALSAAYGLQLDPDTRIEELSVGLRQRVEILKALYRGAEILILDEPTAVLAPQEVQELFRAIRSLTAQGKTVIFITHKLREVRAVADRVTVMRQGRTVGTFRVGEISEEELAAQMVGRSVLRVVEKPPPQAGPPVLTVRGLHYVDEVGRHVLRGVFLEMRAGEILGIAGVEGNGQSELVEILAGLRIPTAGEIRVDGRPLPWGDPRRIRQMGVAHIPEDRLRNGAALTASIAENLIADRYFEPPFSRKIGWMDLKAVRQHAQRWMAAYDIRAPDPQTPAGALSGGNLQRVILARELSRRPRVLLAAQPTRGLDVGATEAVHRFLIQQRQEGTAVLLISADLSELLALSDRLAVMHNGEIVALFEDLREVTEEEIGLYMLGLKRMEG